jgi:hypothetical protein
MERIRSLLFILGVLALLFVSACGDSSDAAATTTTVAPTTTIAAPTTVAPTTTVAATTTTVAPTTTQAADGRPTELNDVPRVTVEELKQSLDDGDDVIVVDAGGRLADYNGGHIPGAVFAAAGYADELAHDQEIILYCA